MFCPSNGSQRRGRTSQRVISFDSEYICPLALISGPCLIRPALHINVHRKTASGEGGREEGKVKSKSESTGGGGHTCMHTL